MAFGQQSGPPATAKQVEQLRALFDELGFADFREARHPFSLTQRQASGKFTRAEADELIETLEARRDGAEPASSESGPAAGAESGVVAEPAPRAARTRPAAAPSSTSAAAPKRSTADALRRVPSDLLAAELQRRGWIVVEP